MALLSINHFYAQEPLRFFQEAACDVNKPFHSMTCICALNLPAYILDSVENSDVCQCLRWPFLALDH